MAAMILKYHGKDRARFHALNRALVSVKNRNAKIPLAGILSEDDLAKVNALIVKMNTLLTDKVPH